MMQTEGGTGGGRSEGTWTLGVSEPRARAAPPGVPAGALSSGQALAAAPHALLLGR